MKAVKALKQRANWATSGIFLALLPLFLIRLALVASLGTIGASLVGLIPAEWLIPYGLNRYQIAKDPLAKSKDLILNTFSWSLLAAPLFTILCFSLGYFDKAGSVASLQESLSMGLATIPALSALGMVGLGILGLPLLVGGAALSFIADSIFRYRHRSALTSASIKQSHERLVRRAKEQAAAGIKDAFAQMEQGRERLLALLSDDGQRRLELSARRPSHRELIYLQLLACERAVVKFWEVCERRLSRKELTYQRHLGAAKSLYDAVLANAMDMAELLDLGKSSAEVEVRLAKSQRAIDHLAAMTDNMKKLRTIKGPSVALDEVQQDIEMLTERLKLFEYSNPS